MWIFDSYFKGCVELWSREGGLSRTSVAYFSSFYMHLKDPHAHWEMIKGLESRCKVEECSFNTIFGSFQGHRIYASRKVAEKIEIQTRYAAELYNVDVRQDQRYPAEKDLFPCGDRDESRFSPDFEVPLSILGMDMLGDPNLPEEISCVQILNGRKQRFEGPEKVVLADLTWDNLRIPYVVQI
jgi:DNA polymerase I